MNNKRIKQYLILPENGKRKDTKLAVEYSGAQITEYIKQGYVLVNQADFNKLIGNAGSEYLIADDGSVYPKPAPTDAELLASAKAAKIAELKAQRDASEVEPIAYHGYSFDYDDKARDRISAAIIALEVLEVAGSSATLTWTTADNKDVKVTASDLRGIIAQVALRSDKLHMVYRKAKEKVETTTTKEEVESIILF